MKFEDLTPSKEESLSLDQTHSDVDFCHICGLSSTVHGSVHDCTASPSLTAGEYYDPRIGQVVGGHYVLTERIGEGGMSFVYKATHELLNQVVAVKLLKPMLLLDQAKLLRFRQEALAVMKLNHPNIVRIYHFEVPQKSEPYLIMDYIEGEPLSEILARDGTLSLERCIEIFSQICDALAHAHEAGIIHRDIKPSNIILCRNSDGSESAKIVDFGIAKLSDSDADGGAQNITRTGEVFGSPLYMSPEQCAAKRLDARSDIYATACVIFEALAGVPPLLGGSALETMHKHVFDAPSSVSKLRPGLPHVAQIEAMLLKALSKHPAHRHQSIKELQADLEALSDKKPQGGLLGEAKTHYQIYQRQKTAKGKNERFPAWILPASALGAVLLAGLLYLFGGLNNQPAQDWHKLIVNGQQQFDRGDLSGAKATFEQSLKLARNEKNGSGDKLAESIAELIDVNRAQNLSTTQLTAQLLEQECSSGAQQDPERTLAEIEALPQNDQSRAKSVLNRAIDEAVLDFSSRRFGEAKRILQAVVDKARVLAPGATKIEARALHDLGLVDKAMSDYEQAREFEEQAVNLAAAINDNTLKGKALLELARLDTLQSNYKEALGRCDSAEELFRNADGPNSRLMASCHNQRGLIYLTQGKYAEAESELRAAITIASGLPAGEHSASDEEEFKINLAKLYTYALIKPDQASKLLEAVMAQLESAEPKSKEDWMNLSNALTTLAALCDQTEQYQRSNSLCTRTLAIIERIAPGQSRALSDALRTKAHLEFDQGQNMAQNSYDKALAATKLAYGSESASTACCLEEIALMFMKAHRFAEAEQALNSASEIFARNQLTEQQKNVLNLLKSCRDRQVKTGHGPVR